MVDRLHFTDSDEANELIARDPLALLIGFALDQQITVQKAFSGPLALRERLGALDARTINEEMKLAAAHAIARVIPDEELHADYIIPSVFNRRVAETVAEEVANAAVSSGVARRKRGATGEPATPLEAIG